MHHPTPQNQDIPPKEKAIHRQHACELLVLALGFFLTVMGYIIFVFMLGEAIRS
ncbi:MAG: hypothetical protein AAGF10_07220 [Verrucomicrobiota bacterium]